MVTFDFNDVHAKSVSVLKLLQSQGCEVSVGAAALGLSFGRLLSPDTMSDSDEVDFVQAIFEWAGAYFVEGEAN